MNNQNDPIEDMDIGCPDLTDVVDNGMIRLCEQMEPYGTLMPVIPTEGNEPCNNQMDSMFNEPNPEKTEYQLVIDHDPTLNYINGPQDEIAGFDVPTFTNLDNYSNQEQQQDQQYFGFAHNGMEEFQPETKAEFAQYVQAQEPIQLYRLETQSQQYVPPFHNSNMEYPEEMDMKNLYLTSPSPTPYSSADIPAYSIDSYYKSDNNTNAYPSMASTPRSRKYSTTSSCGGKMTATKIIGKIALEKGEKPFRNRKTKAEMEAMTPEQKEARKKNQNRLNAKNCVLRKNDEKSQKKDRIPIMETNVEIITKANELQENGLLSVYENVVYPMLNNNSPFGTPQQFNEELQHAKLQTVDDIQIDNNENVIQLEEESKRCEDVFKLVEAAKGDTSIPQNTYASRKSRAKTAMELAQLKQKTFELNLEIQKGQAIGQILKEFTRNINPFVADAREKCLPEEIVYYGFTQFEPS